MDYKTKGTCSTNIHFEVEDGKVKNISEIKLQETVRKDALKHKIVEQREESKKKKKKRTMCRNRFWHMKKNI